MDIVLSLEFPTGQDATVLSRRTKGQKFLHCPATKGQWDKLKILPWDGPGLDFDILPRDGLGRDGILTFCHGTDRDRILTFCHGTGF